MQTRKLDLLLKTANVPTKINVLLDLFNSQAPTPFEAQLSSDSFKLTTIADAPVYPTSLTIKLIDFLSLFGKDISVEIYYGVGEDSANKYYAIAFNSFTEVAKYFGEHNLIPSSVVSLLNEIQLEDKPEVFNAFKTVTHKELNCFSLMLDSLLKQNCFGQYAKMTVLYDKILIETIPDRAAKYAVRDEFIKDKLGLEFLNLDGRYGFYIMLSDLVTNPILKKLVDRRVWAFDFDKTITKQHTYFKPEFNFSLLTPTEVLANIRNADFLKQFIIERKNAGDVIIIVTLNHDLPHVKGYLDTLFDGNCSAYISHINCTAKSRQTKVPDIQQSLGELHLDNLILSNNIILIDDTHSYRDETLRAGYRFVHADEANNDYMGQLTDICQNIFGEETRSLLSAHSLGIFSRQTAPLESDTHISRRLY